MCPQVFLGVVLVVPLGVENVKKGVHVIQGVPRLELANPLAYLVVRWGLVGARNLLHSQRILLFLIVRIWDLTQVSEDNYWCAHHMFALEFLGRDQVRYLNGCTTVL